MPGLTHGPPAETPSDVHSWLQDMLHRAHYDIGHPHAADLPHPDLGARLAQIGPVNIGDPWDEVNLRGHSSAFEREVINVIGEVICAPPTRCGFVTNGSAAAIEHAIATAAHPVGDQPIACASNTARGSLGQACARHRIPMVTTRAQARGAIDILDLHQQLGLRRHRPALIIAVLGTTRPEVVDDLAATNRITGDLALRRVHLHADAARSSLPLALLPDTERPPLHLRRRPGPDLLVHVRHTFLGVTNTCTVIIYWHRPDRSAPAGKGWVGQPTGRPVQHVNKPVRRSDLCGQWLSQHRCAQYRR